MIDLELMVSNWYPALDAFFVSQLKWMERKKGKVGFSHLCWIRGDNLFVLFWKQSNVVFLLFFSFIYQKENFLK